MKRPLLIALVGAALLSASARITAQGPDGPLTHFTSDFVTGDVVVGGASLFRAGVNGLATRDIVISGVPAGAEILSAYLYIQTTFRETDGEDAGMAGATFKGHSLNTAAGPIAKALNWNPAAPTLACWSYGWNPRRPLVTYRADVLRFLEIGPDGKHIANGPHRVQVADAGRLTFRDFEEDSPAMAAPRAVGASLVLVYRHPNPAAPLRAIVIYDGGVTKRAYETMTQRIQGFYQPAAVDPGAKMIHLVGDGQLLLSERVTFGALTFPNNPFIGANGLRWDNPTFNLNSALQNYPDASNLNTTTVSPNGLLSDCLSWSAIIVSTKVQDTDNDGLVDLWESSDSQIVDPDGEPLPNLKAMGANPNVKDIFAEVAALKSDHEITYGVGEAAKTKAAHTHFPSKAALKLVADAFKNAPQPINVHFDVGNQYQEIDPATGSIDPYIVPAALAKGGKTFSETAVCADPGNPAGPLVDCFVQTPPLPIPGQYPNHPGTVGWKTGFFFYRDKLVEFESARKNIFRFALFAHALGLPKSELELLPDGTPNPDFHTPRTSSGVADWAGGDVLITLGAFDDNDGNPIGTDFMQASTLMHEWGHNFGRRHGGDLFEPNCKPQYLSVMNYLYQLRGLLDDQGTPHLNYNGGVTGTLPESGLTADIFAPAPLPYRMGWYVPKSTSYLKHLTGGSATKHCDGSELSQAEKDDLAAGGGMVRVDGISVGGSIDWDADGTTGAVLSQDINFNGMIEDLGPGSDDWSKIRLNQLGARRSIGGLFLDKLGRPTIGPLSLNIDSGKGDLGKGDLGKGDLGKGDLGKGDLGKGDLGKGDLGKGDLGKGDLGKGDLGSGVIVAVNLGKGDLGKGDLGQGDLDVGSGTPAEHPDVVPPSLSYEDAKAVTGGKPGPPSGLVACLTSDGECATDGGTRPVRLAWLKPNEGDVVNYFVYRFAYQTETFQAPAALSEEDRIGTTEGSETTFVDHDAPAGTKLAYYVIAQFASEEFSGISNFATIETPAAIDFVDLGTAAPPATLAGQEMYPFDDGRENGTETEVPSPLGGSLTFGAPVVHRTVNGVPFDEGGWRTWSHGYTGDVYYSGVETTSVTMTLPPGTTAFYFYAEPRNFGLFQFTVTTTNGGTIVVPTGDVFIEGNAGAHGFGFVAAGTTIANITVTASPEANGFAVGEFGIAGPPFTPEP